MYKLRPLHNLTGQYIPSIYSISICDVVCISIIFSIVLLFIVDITLRKLKNGQLSNNKKKQAANVSVCKCSYRTKSEFFKQSCKIGAFLRSFLPSPMIGIQYILYMFIYAVGARWLLGVHGPTICAPNNHHHCIMYIGAGKNNLGNAPTVILEKVSGNQV